jgi:hypothetical protein
MSGKVTDTVRDAPANGASLKVAFRMTPRHPTDHFILKPT